MPTSEHPSERVLFEWRANPDGSVTVTTSRAWDEYHAQRMRPRRLTGTPRKDNARRKASAARDTLQRLYDDIYPAASDK